MNQPGKYIAYLLFGLFIAAALMPSCTDGNGPDGFNQPEDKISLSISFQSEQSTRAENGLRANEGGEIDSAVFERENAIYSLAVLVFKGKGALDGKKVINRVSKPGTASTDSNYVTLDEIKGIKLTAGIRDVYVIANAPDGCFDGVGDFDSFKARTEALNNQKIYGYANIDLEDPIGGVTPVDRFTNLVMSQSFIGLYLNSGAPVHYLGYENITGKGVLQDEVKLVRLVARVAIQKITFDLPETLTFDPGISTSEYNHYVDTVFLINAKTVSSYFPGNNAFPKPADSFGHGNTIGYNFLKGKFSTIPAGSTYADCLYKPINFAEYDITKNQVPLWFYAFENGDSEAPPTAFVIGVKYQYVNPGESQVKRKKVYYPVVVNANGSNNGASHNFIKRNNQYGIKVTIKGLGSYVADYPELKSTTLPAMNSFSDAEGVLEIEETIGPNLFPWIGDVYK